MYGPYGSDPYGISPYGSVPGETSFRVVSAESSSNTQVLVHFTFPLNLTYPPFLNPANYSIPGLTVLSANIADATTIRLTTTPQSYVLYTVTVTQGQSAGGDSLDLLHRSADFSGTPSVPVFTPVGVRRNSIRLVFTEPMLLNAAILDLTSYSVVDIHNQPVTLQSVFTEQGVQNPLAITLQIDAPLMVAAEWYVVTIGPGVVSAAFGLSIEPATQKFQWIEPTLATSIPIVKFSGEALGGILGQHAGLVYFSPALNSAVSDSIIQVDSVEVCSKAYDEYVFPVIPDPPALFCFGGSVALSGTLNSESVLWGAFPRLNEARLDLAARHVEPMPTAIDSRAIATFTEQWDIAYVALLNSPGWALYDGATSVTPPTFICANNLGPIPPGPTTTIVLQP